MLPAKFIITEIVLYVSLDYDVNTVNLDVILVFFTNLFFFVLLCKFRFSKTSYDFNGCYL